MTHVTRIDGSPGAGKSYTLKQQAAREKRENDVGLSDVYWISFTNAATDDAIGELADVYDGRPRDDVEPSVRTLHSVALSEVRRTDAIEDYEQQVISQRSEAGKESNIYREFARKNGMGYSGHDLRDGRETAKKPKAADILYNLHVWLTLSSHPPEKARKAPFPLPWPTERAVDLLNDWNHYKQTRWGLPRYEHCDYLQVAIDRGLTPDVDVIYVDEFQDFSPQEYEYYTLLRDSMDRVYIAGDPDQSIYSFRAGHPYYFRNTDVDDEVYLSDSYRCPQAVADFARRVLNGSPDNSTDFSAVQDGGSVEWINGGTDANLKQAVDTGIAYESGAFILARTNSKVDSIQRWLNRHGYPHETLGTRRKSIWTNHMEEMLMVLRSLRSRSDGGVSKAGVAKLMERTPQKNLRKEVLDSHGGVYSIRSVWKAFTDASTVAQIIEKLDIESYKRQALESAAVRHQTNDPDEIKVGTIHAAKGLERPCVLLFNSWNGHIEQRYHEDTDVQAEEHRIAYVGATRASERVYVVDGFFDGPKMKPLENARREVVVR